ncbi:MAG: hypothetical protein N2C14_10365, partial [Planctomycetales bacterium]
VDLSCWLQSMDLNRAQQGNTVIAKLPVLREELFKYDAILLLDPNPRDFSSSWIQLLRQFVSEHAGGMLYMAGPKYTARFLTGGVTRQLGDLLPVRVGDVGQIEVASLLTTPTREWELGIVPRNIDQPIMRFYSDSDRALRQWEALPGFYWSFPCEEAKPAARTLIEHTGPPPYRGRPLLVAGLHGSGRSVYLGFNGTWRWRKAASEAEFHKRFWIQTTRYLIEGRSIEGKRRGLIETERTNYVLGDRVAVEAQLKNASFQPLDLPVAQAVLKTPNSPDQIIELQPVPNRKGRYQAVLTAAHRGSHLLSVRLPGSSSGKIKVETSFSVTAPSVESKEVWLNQPLLRELAEVSGGQYFEINQLASLVDAVPDRRRRVEVVGKPVPLWDNSRLLLLLVGLLTVEWSVRRKYRLM